MFFTFNELQTAPLIVDAVYEGGWKSRNLADEPLSKIFQDVGSGLGNSGGFRLSGKSSGSGYCVLYTTGNEPDWPDELDLRAGIFTYYGDNRSAGRAVSSKKGNKILESSFASLHASESPRQNVVPFLIFEKFPTERSQRSVRFRGLAVPGFEGYTSNEDLVAIWRSKEDQRFQNYRATFSVLDIGEVPRSWLANPQEKRLMPSVWLNWVKTGRAKRLQAAPTLEIRKPSEQTPSSIDDRSLIQEVYKHFRDRPADFGSFAAYIFQMMYPDALIDEVTRATVDGGRDAIGRLPLGPPSDPIYLDFSLEAKCYAPASPEGNGNSVTVGDTKRLISRLKHRQFGVLVTTSFVAQQAYKEIREDGHPVIIVSGADIAAVLKKADFGDKNSLQKLLSSY